VAAADFIRRAVGPTSRGPPLERVALASRTGLPLVGHRSPVGTWRAAIAPTSEIAPAAEIGRTLAIDRTLAIGPAPVIDRPSLAIGQVVAIDRALPM
jgi:hypothetical protein